MEIKLTGNPEIDRNMVEQMDAVHNAYCVRDPEGKEVCVGTHNECWTYILRHQGQSVMYATKYGGWRIAKLP